MAAAIGASKQNVSNVLCGQHGAALETLGKWAAKVKGAEGRPIVAIVVYDGVVRVMLDLMGVNVEGVMGAFTSPVEYTHEGMVVVTC